MGVENLVVLRYHGRSYTGSISQCHQQLVSKVIVGLCIPIIVRVITIWNEVFLKLRVSFDVLVSIKKVLSDSIPCIEKNIDVVVQVL